MEGCPKGGVVYPCRHKKTGSFNKVGDDAYIVPRGRTNCGTMWASSPTTQLDPHNLKDPKMLRRLIEQILVVHVIPGLTRAPLNFANLGGDLRVKPHSREFKLQMGYQGSHTGLPLQTVQQPNVGAALRGRPLSAHCRFDIDWHLFLAFGVEPAMTNH